MGLRLKDPKEELLLKELYRALLGTVWHCVARCGSGPYTSSTLLEARAEKIHMARVRTPEELQTPSLE